MPWDASALRPLVSKDSVLESRIKEENTPVRALFVPVLVEFRYRVVFLLMCCMTKGETNFINKLIETTNSY